MNCHDNKNGNHKSHSAFKHMFHMILCCGIPILIVALLPFLNLNSGLKAVIAGITPFICPIMMILMVPMMLKGMSKEQPNKNKIQDNYSVIDKNKADNTIK